MSSIARVGDLCVGTCSCHTTPIPMTGTIFLGSADATCNGLGIGRVGDLVIGNCGHIATIVTGAPSSLCNGQSVARVGSLHTGCFVGNVVLGSPDAITG